MNRRRTWFPLIPVALAVLAATVSTGPSSNPRSPLTGARGEEHEAVPGLDRYEEVQAQMDWFYGQRVLPGTTIPAMARASAVEQARALASHGHALSAAWTSLGPQPVNAADPRFSDIDTNGSVYQNGFGKVSGRVTALAVAPGNANIVYMGAADGGVWKTTNGGGTWTPIGDQLDSLSIGSISVNLSKPRIVYVGTGEANTSSDSYYGSGIYKSTDAGATFTKIGGSTFDLATVFRIISRGQYILAATNHGLYRSADYGVTWAQVLAPGGTSDLYANFVSDLTFAKGYGFVAAIGWRAGDASNGLYQSLDAGATWTKLTPAGFPAQNNLGRISLAATPKQPGLLYAVIQDAVLFGLPTYNTLLNGVYKSTTGPAGPWTLVATSQLFASDPNSALSADKIGPTYQPGIQAWYNNYVTIDPTNPDDVVVGLEEIYNTTDGGQSWHTIGRYWNVCLTDPGPPGCWQDPIQHPTTHPDQHAAAWGVVGGQPKLYVGSDGGVWSQLGPTWNNDNWSDLNDTLSVTQPYMAEASSGLGAVYAGNQDNGTMKYEGSLTWPQIFGGDGGDVAVYPNDPNSTFEEYVYLDMSKSTNGGVNWTNSVGPSDAGSSSTARFIAPFDLDPLDPNHVVALGQHVAESHDGINTTSSSWTDTYDNGSGHVGTALAVRGATIYEGWCGPCNPNVIDVDSPFARGLATNVGGTWHATGANGLPNRYVTGIAIDPANDSHVFVTLSAFSRRWIPRAGEGHVFESTDGGENFTDVSSNLPDAPANDAVLWGGRLIVGTDVGVYERMGDGTWAELGTGLPNASVLDLSLVPGGPTLVAATHGRGVWTIPLA